MSRIPFALALLLGALPAIAQDVYVPIEKRLTAEQMHETGLAELTPRQLELLNRLLAADRSNAVEQAREEAKHEPARAERVPVESRISGSFRGWQPGLVLVLENGQRWRVTEGDYATRAVESPRVSIRPGVVSGWYLRVEGQTPTAKVRPVD